MDWLDGDLPSIGVEWYAKTMPKGLILDNPTVFGMHNGKLLGGGEAGKEVVVSAQSLMGMIDASIHNAMSLMYPERAITTNDFDYCLMEHIMKRTVADAQVELNLLVDGRILARQIVKTMDRNWQRS